MKSLVEIRNEKPCYFVSIDGTNEFESSSIVECKRYLINYIKNNYIDVNESYNYYIGMYNISIDD